MDDERAERVADNVNHPPHYNAHPSGIEAIDVCEHLSFCLGNAVKYVWRAGNKGDRIEDLKKALWYLDREDRRHRSFWQTLVEWWAWSRMSFSRELWMIVARDVIKATEGPDLLAAVLGKLIDGDIEGARRSVAIAIDFAEEQAAHERDRLGQERIAE